MGISTLNPTANGTVTWRDWRITHGDDGILVERAFCPPGRNRPEWYCASLTTAMSVAEMMSVKGTWCRDLPDTLLSQLDTIHEKYAEEGLWDALKENREATRQQVIDAANNLLLRWKRMSF